MLRASSAKTPYAMIGIIQQQHIWLNCSSEAEK